MRSSVFTCAFFLGSFSIASFSQAKSPDKIPTLEHDILPLLQKNCMGCHGGLKQKAGLDLRTLDSMLKGGDDGEVLIKGKPQDSTLWLSVVEDEMPKGKNKDKLTAEEKNTLKTWIEKGFPTVADLQKPVRTNLSGKGQHSPTEVAAEVDRLILNKLKEHTLPHTNLASDEEFLRRTSLDLNGRVPDQSLVQSFLESKEENKREKLVQELLQSTEYGNHFGRVWRDWICPPELPSDQNGGKQPHKQAREMGAWFAKHFNDSATWDKTVSELLNFNGELKNNQQAIFYSLIGQDAKSDPANSARTISSLFMGMQTQCAQCHDDPYRDFAQSEFWGLSAFFGSMYADFKKVESKPNHPEIVIPKSAFKNAGTKVKASFPGDKTIDQEDKSDWRPFFSKWLTSKDNPFFAKAFVNRLWFQLFSRGLVNPIDDIRPLNPPTHPALLEMLADEFVASGYDVRHLILCIALSDTYQRSSFIDTKLPHAQATSQLELFGRAPVKVMSTDQLHQSLQLALGEKRLDLRTHSKEDGNTNGESAAVGDEYLEFQRRFATNEEDLTDFTHGIPQMLTFLNHPRLLKGSLNLTEHKKKNPDFDETQMVQWLYRSSLSRSPTKEELNDALDYAKSTQDFNTASNELLWVLLNQTEFILVK